MLASGARAAEPAARGLNARAASRGLFFGTAIDHTLMHEDAGYMSHVPAECGMIVGEATFKWAHLQPEEGKFTFEEADALLDYAARHRLRARGHTLVWHEAMPDWLVKAITPASAEKLLTEHIRTVTQHFRRKLAHWDVVNEVVRPEDSNPLGLRDTPWLRAMGDRYIDVAFAACAEHDPGALRVLNEFGTDYAVPWEEAKRSALLRLLASLKARNVPIQAVGLQAHLDASQVALDQRVLNRFVQSIADMGLGVMVTELDVRDQGLPADIPSRDVAVAAHARAWLDAVLAVPAVTGVLSWGLSDRRSWLNDKFARPDGLLQRALPLDADLRRKKLWEAVGAALDSAPRRAA